MPQETGDHRYPSGGILLKQNRKRAVLYGQDEAQDRFRHRPCHLRHALSDQRAAVLSYYVINETGSIYLAWQEKGQHAVEPLLYCAQHNQDKSVRAGTGNMRRKSRAIRKRKLSKNGFFYRLVMW